jgi:hypothetical protein
MLESGQSMFDSLPKEVVATRLKAAEASGGLSVAPPAASAFNIDITTGHDAMISAPRLLTELLCDIAG